MTTHRSTFQASATALSLFPADQLLSALSREVQSHLTATRMHAELFELGRSPQSSSRAVLAAAGRAAALNACIAPLSQPRSAPCALTPLHLLECVHGRVSTYSSELVLQQLSSQTLRHARGDLEECTRVLSLLVTEMHCASGNDAPVTIAAGVAGDRTEITLTMEGERPPVVNPAHPGTGLALGLHIAEAVASRHNGYLGLHSLPFWQRVTLQLPAAP